MGKLTFLSTVYEGAYFPTPLLTVFSDLLIFTLLIIKKSYLIAFFCISPESNSSLRQVKGIQGEEKGVVLEAEKEAVICPRFSSSLGLALNKLPEIPRILN